jgi:uncharacterized protein YjdB
MKLAATQSAAVHVTFRNANGFPAKTDGEVVWESSNPEIASVVADITDSTKAVVTAGGTAGFTTVTASADADLGDGIAEVSATLEIDVIARGVAIGGEIDVDTPDQGLPGGPPPIPEQGLPESPDRPDNSLPDVDAEPK